MAWWHNLPDLAPTFRQRSEHPLVTNAQPAMPSTERAAMLASHFSPADAGSPLAAAPTAAASAGYKMLFLICRRPGVTKAELHANWFANHMPGVIAAMGKAREAGRPAARRYIAALFDQSAGEKWDGVAMLWWDARPAAPKEPHGTKPMDTFQERAGTYVPWATIETVLLDGQLGGKPNTLNAPYPFSRTGFGKVTILHPAEARGSLEKEAEQRTATLQAAGAFRHVVCVSVDSDVQYGGMEEIYFPSVDRAREWIGGKGKQVKGTVLLGETEMVGIP